MAVAIEQAKRRRRRLTLVVKKSGVPSISDLWLRVFESSIRDEGLNGDVLEIDHAVFHLVQHARTLDVVVAPNLFGDVLADAAGLLLGSRGLCYSANFGPRNQAVYQTGHGAALDIAGRNVANPTAHLLALVMLLRQSFGLVDLSERILRAVRVTLAEGVRTADLSRNAASVVGTREFGERVVRNLEGGSTRLVSELDARR